MKATTFTIHSKKYEHHEGLRKKRQSQLISKGFTFDNENPDVVIVVGGDGTFLREVRNRKFNGRFVLLNTGHLGIFSEFSIEEANKLLYAILEKEPEEEVLPLGKITNSTGNYDYFLNDVCIEGLKTCWVTARIDDEILTTIRGNGIVISTPIGSSGYAASLGSPFRIGSPDVYEFATIAPCYNRLSFNPINKVIISNKKTLSIELRGKRIPVLDGISAGSLRDNKFVFAPKSEKTLTLLHFRKQNEVIRLRERISGK